jgi:hypothetical protein
MIRELTVSMALLSLMPGWTALAQTDGPVKITPLGGQEGEFCAQDRALVFEDRCRTPIR